ncbi:MAG: DUF1360 domain-containing protein [Myxococcaceae bacterium]
MGLSHTISRERICEPLRRKLGGKETWTGYLVSCPWCVSHWLAFALVPLTGLYPIRVAVAWAPLASVIEWFLASILVTVLAGFLRVLFWLVDEEQGLVRRRQRRVEEEASTRALLRRHLEEEERTHPHAH